jgi:hypothetical protein
MRLVYPNDGDEYLGELQEDIEDILDGVRHAFSSCYT